MKLIVKFIAELYRIGQGFGILFAIRYIGYTILSFRTVLESKSLGFVDTKIRKNVSVTAMGYRLSLLGDTMPTIREVLLKNCYGFDASKRYATIIDLGANRGVFSVVAGKCSGNVISVECNKEEFADKFKLIMTMNAVGNVTLVNAFASSYNDETHISLNQIVRDYGVQEISYLKIDIEGAESDLFSSNLEWLTITRQISMEIHPCRGVDAQRIQDVLGKVGFALRCYDSDMRQVPDFAGIDMGYLRAAR
jgi:hypothetical protein